MTLQILWTAVTSHLFLWPTGCEWHCTFYERQSHHILSYDQQQVSDIVHFVKGSLITSFPMTNRMWVTLHIFWKAVSSHLFLWLTASEWHCTFSERQSHHIFSHHQQFVSDIAHLEKTASSHLFPWSTVCEWHCIFCERQSHCIFSYDQQEVSDIAHFVKGSPITSFPMANSKWVTLHILWKAIPPFLWPTASEWHCIFCERQSHHIFSYDQQFVSDILLQILWKAVSSHLFLWPTASKQHSMHMWLKAVSSHLFLWPTGCEWHCTFSERQSYPMTNSLWVTLHILSKAVSSLFFLWTTASEQDCKFSNLHFPMFVYQKVSMLPYLFHVFIIIIDCKISFMSFIPLSLISCHRWVILVHWVLIFKSVFMTVPCRSDWQFDIHWMFYSIS